MRTREDVAACINVTRRRFAATYEADAAKLVAAGKAATMAEARAIVAAPVDLFGDATADDVDARCFSMWEALQRQWAYFQAHSPRWPECVRSEWMERMQAEQEWLLAMRDQLGTPLDIGDVRDAEQAIEREERERVRATQQTSISSR